MKYILKNGKEYISLEDAAKNLRIQSGKDTKKNTTMNKSAEDEVEEVIPAERITIEYEEKIAERTKKAQKTKQAKETKEEKEAKKAKKAKKEEKAKKKKEQAEKGEKTEKKFTKQKIKLNILEDTLYRDIRRGEYDGIVDPYGEPERAGGYWPIFHQQEDDMIKIYANGDRVKNVISMRLYQVIKAVRLNDFERWYERGINNYLSVFDEAKRNIKDYSKEFESTDYEPKDVDRFLRKVEEEFKTLEVKGNELFEIYLKINTAFSDDNGIGTLAVKDEKKDD